MDSIIFLENSNERIPNRKDSDYYDSYENLSWEPTPWYKKILNFMNQFLYFISGPKFVVLISGLVQEKRRSKKVSDYIATNSKTKTNTVKCH